LSSDLNQTVPEGDGGGNVRRSCWSAGGNRVSTQNYYPVTVFYRISVTGYPKPVYL